MFNPNITIDPASDEIGVPLGQDIVIIFDTEVDVGSILDGNIVISGILDSLWTGAAYSMHTMHSRQAFETPLLNTPTLTGPLDYDIVVKRIDSDGNEVATIDDGSDASSGDLYQTKVILKPKDILKANTKYGVIVSSDISANTVYDTVYNVDLNSSGKAIFTGPYTGDSDDEFVVRVTAGSTFSDLQFNWYKSSNPAVITSVNSANKRTVYLIDGVSVSFDTGTFTVGDSLTAAVTPQNNLDQPATWSFITGSGSTITPSSTETTSITNVAIIDGDLAEAQTVVQDGYFAYDYSSLANYSYQVPLTLGSIDLDMDIALDPTSIDLTKIKLIGEDLLPDIFVSGPLEVTYAIAGATASGTVVTISLDDLNSHTVYTLSWEDGMVKDAEGNQLKAGSIVFLTLFDSFYSTPSYVMIAGGGVLDNAPEILLAEKIGIISANARDIFGPCINRINGLDPEKRAYVASVLRSYTTDMVIKSILENSDRLTSMTKQIETFKIQFGGGRNKPYFDEIQKAIKKMLPVLRSCAQVGIDQMPLPETFEKASTSAFPFVRGRAEYVSGQVPGLNDNIMISTNVRSRNWRNRNGN